MKQMNKKDKSKNTPAKITATDVSTLSLEMIKQRIRPGEAYTQKELCELLDQPKFKANNQKNAQLRAWKRFFDFEEDDDGYLIINEIYDQVLPRIPNAIRKDSLYAQYIEYLLMNYLYNQESNQANMTAKRWWLTISMINANYEKLFSKNPNDIAWIKNITLDMQEEDIINFKERTSAKFYNVFSQVLKRMRDKSYIMYEQVYMIGSSYDELHEATNDEKEIWLTCERSARAEFNKERLKKDPHAIEIKTLSQLYILSQAQQNRYWDLVEKHQRKQGWGVAFVSIKIIFTKYGMKQDIETDTPKIQQIKKQLNENFELFFNHNLIHKNGLNMYMHNHNITDYSTKNLLGLEPISNNRKFRSVHNELALTQSMIVNQ